MDKYVDTQSGTYFTGYPEPLPVSLFPSTRVYTSPRHVPLPDHLETMFFRVWTQHQRLILPCVRFYPQRQGVNSLTSYSPTWMSFYSSTDLTIHVVFPTHFSGKKKKSGLPKNIIICHPFSTVGWSDQYAVLRVFRISAKRDSPLVHTHWLWGSVDWNASVMLYNICLEALSSLVIWMNKFMHSQDPLSPTEKTYVTHQFCAVNPHDQWSGYHCRVAVDAKSCNWRPDSS